MRLCTVILIGTLAGGSLAIAARAQDAGAWVGALAEGDTLAVHTVVGSIEISPANGAEARVTGARPDEGWARLRVVRENSRTVVCALVEGYACGPGGLGRSGSAGGDGDERTDLRVALPAGVHLVAGSGDGRVAVRGAQGIVAVQTGSGAVEVHGSGGRVQAQTGHGSIRVTDAGGPVSARTGNGGVTVRTRYGPVAASTGNGAINVTIDELSTRGDLEFTTGNGRVVIEVPSDLDADLEVRLASGSLESDFPIIVQGVAEPGSLRGTIGVGGRRLLIRSGKGGAVLRRR